MNILVLGSGGREHTLAWKIAQSPLCNNLFVAPGNGGTDQVATNLPISVDDFQAVGNAILEHNIDLLVVGPEAPLVAGVRDYLEADERYHNLKIVGPGSKGAQLEGSKDFSKAFMVKHDIPTGKAETFRKGQLSEAINYLDTISPPFVLKADGLAAGKGVIITEDKGEAIKSLKEMLENSMFGEASEKVLIEEFLDGIELSVFVLTDGTNYKILPEAKDYKRIGDGDTGPNTGGMGAISPVSFADDSFMSKVEERIIKPTVNGLREDDIEFIGFIFIGLMNVNGDPYVIEYNVRMGDPETQAVIPRLDTDLAALLKAAATGDLQNTDLAIREDFAATVVMVAGGYPASYNKGDAIEGISNANSLVFHAGTKKDGPGLVTNGGRILAVTALGTDLASTVEKAYDDVTNIRWDNVSYRRDIGKDLLELQ